MLAETEFIILPYASERGRSILQLLANELSNGRWTAFRGAVAFAKQSGNDLRLLRALAKFAKGGGTVALTIGADVFGPSSRGSEYDAVKTLLETLEPFPDAKLYLYHERYRTFHPKLYLFSNCHTSRALAIVGSSNWTEGGLVENVEANVLVKFDLTQREHKIAFDGLVDTLESYWAEEE